MVPRVLLKICLCAVSLFLAFVICETYLVLTDYQKQPFPKNIYPEIGDIKRYKKFSFVRFDKDLLYIPRENWGSFDDIEGFDEYGFRLNKDHSLNELHQNIIVMIGDSFTYGDHVRNENAYPAITERILKQKGYDVIVHNAGVSGYGSDQEYFYLINKVLKKVSPKIVVWNLHMSDFYDNISPLIYKLENGILKRKSTFSDYSVVKSILDVSFLPMWIRQSSLYNFIFASLKTLQEKDAHDGADEFAKVQQKKLEVQIENLVSLGREEGFELLLILSPPQFLFLSQKDVSNRGNYEVLLEILEKYPNSLVAGEKFEELFVEKNLQVISSHDERVLGISSAEAINENLYLTSERDINPGLGWKHLNEYGNFAFANIVAAELEKYLK